ncbi:MAG TPA: alpha/beta hydrolase [Actinomycetota bacterium]|nr:alpha/beta hydrolase [Actinomycetota bacterium]
MEEVSLPVICDGIRLAAGGIVPDEARGAAVLLHGIPSVTPPDSGDTGYPGFAKRFAERSWAAAWVDMRAVRGSKGFFSIEGWVRDARAVIEAVRGTEGFSGLPLALIGSSAGGAVACEVVARGTSVDALVLLAAPATWLSFAADGAAAVTRITQDAGMALAPETVADPTSWAEEFSRVTPERSIVNVRVPTLIVHGSDDDVVPVDHAELLGERAPRADVRVVRGAGHQLRTDDEAMSIVFEWLERNLR